MKKQFIISVCGSVIYFLSFNISFGQEQQVKELPPVTVTATTSHSVVTERVNKSFGKMFKNASDPRWYKLNEKFLVLFIENDLQNRALFAKNGQLVYRICYGSEKTMPAEIRQLVKRNYYDQTITWVYQVNQNNRTIWVINVEDAKDLVMLRVEEMELEETQRIAKW